MAKDYRNIKETSRFAQVLEGDIYGGWVTALTASVPEGTLFTEIVNGGIDTTLREVRHEVLGISKGTGDNATFYVNLVGVDTEQSGGTLGAVTNWNVTAFGFGYRSRITYETTTTRNGDPGDGSGFSAQLLSDRKGYAVEIAAVINAGQGYMISDDIEFSGDDGVGVPAQFQPFKIKVTGVNNIGGVTTYTSYALKSVEPSILTILADGDNGIDMFQEFLKKDGTTRYHIDEPIRISGQQLLEESTDFDINCIVTDISYVSHIPTSRLRKEMPFYDNHNIQLLYDRFDKLHFVKVINDIDHSPVQGDGTIVIHDFDGNDYTPDALPQATEFVNYTIEQGNTENAKVIFNFSNDADARYNFTKAEVQADVRDSLGLLVKAVYVSNGSVVVELNSKNQEQGQEYTLPEQIAIPIFIDFYDVLGFNISKRINVFSLSPEASDSDIFATSNYTKWVGDPYLIDEAYHVVLYNEKDFRDRNYGVGNGNINLTNGIYITEIGLPFHLAEGDTNVLTDDQISNFNLAITIQEIVLDNDTITQQYINDNFLVNEEYTINKDVTVTGVRRFNETDPENPNPDRYIFFEIEPFVYTGGSFLVLMYMDGNPINFGWNAGYIDSQAIQQEVLGFSSENSAGQESVVGTFNKLCLAFTHKKV